MKICTSDSQKAVSATIFEKTPYLFSILLKPEIQSFIREHESDDLSTLILKSREVLGVPIGGIATQIEGRKKAKEKLPVYYSTAGIIYPQAVSMEQSSSEATAKFKSTLALEKISGRSLCVDLTGGLGVDSFFLSRVFDKVSYIEPNTELLEIARHNHLQLRAKNISYHNVDAQAFLKSAHTKIDCIYLDPSAGTHTIGKFLRWPLANRTSWNFCLRSFSALNMFC